MGIAGWLHLLGFGLLLPIAAIRDKQKRDQGQKYPPKKAFFASVLLNLFILGGLSVLVARIEGIPLFQPAVFTTGAIAFAAAFFGAHAVHGFFDARRSVRERDPKLWQALPTDGAERALWCAISLAAAVGEEIAYRGVLIELVQRAGAGFPLAVVLCSLAFGLAHASQSWTAAAVVTGHAAVMHLLVLYSGSLYLAMGVHFLHDLWIGLYVGRLARRAGWQPDP